MSEGEQHHGTPIVIFGHRGEPGRAWARGMSLPLAGTISGMGKDAADIVEATGSFEKWLGKQIPLIARDLIAKHKLMARGAFPFLRGTFYRWTQIWPAVCPDVSAAPAVLAVGDLHVENFGTWRDAEGRLAWGVNDFDEAFVLPYTNDLVRLAASAILAIEEQHLALKGKQACSAILQGYEQSLTTGGGPIVIEEKHRWLMTLLRARNRIPDAAEFWAHLRGATGKASSAKIPPEAKAALMARLPVGSTDIRIVPRQAGVGSLGRPRFVAIATWVGAPIAREIKAVLPSACVWNQDLQKSASSRSNIPKLIEATVAMGLRCPDPFFDVDRRWITRRLAYDSHKIELNVSPVGPDELRLLQAMGRETANVHLASKSAVPAIRKDLARRQPGWLYAAARDMVNATMADYKQWRRASEGDRE